MISSRWVRLAATIETQEFCGRNGALPCWLEPNYIARMMSANDNDPPSRLRIVADDPAEGDQVCIAIHPGHIYATDREEAFNIGLDLLDKALAKKAWLLSLVDEAYPELRDEPETLEELESRLQQPIVRTTGIMNLSDFTEETRESFLVEFQLRLLDKLRLFNSLKRRNPAA
jgi:hypothetical protein